METDTDIDFADDTDKNPVSIDIPKEHRKLQNQAYDKSVQDIIDMITRGDIILNPEYQRKYVWNNKQASLFVESILLNVPLPIIYVAEEDDGKWSIIDGLQRVNSLRRFFSNEFKLTQLEVLKELKTTYSKLNPTAQRVLRNGSMRFILIFKDSHPEIKYDIFMRLNRGAIKLSEQELRNCLYRGNFNDLLKTLAQNKQFLKILKLKEPHRRMKDVEMILRFFAVTDDYNSTQEKMTAYRGNMKTFLNSYMGNKKSIDDPTLNKYSDSFTTTIDKVHSVFGENAFRRINPDGTTETAINRALADCILQSFTLVEKDALVQKKSVIRELLKNLPSTDSDFKDSLSLGTSETSRLECRLKTFSRELLKICA